MNNKQLSVNKHKSLDQFNNSKKNTYEYLYMRMRTKSHFVKMFNILIVLLKKLKTLKLRAVSHPFSWKPNYILVFQLQSFVLLLLLYFQFPSDTNRSLYRFKISNFFQFCFQNWDYFCPRSFPNSLRRHYHRFYHKTHNVIGDQCSTGLRKGRSAVSKLTGPCGRLHALWVVFTDVGRWRVQDTGNERRQWEQWR